MKDTIYMPVSNPWVAMDLDGTVMEDGYYPLMGPPRAGAKEALIELQNMGVKIMIFTARTSLVGLNGDFQNVNREVNSIYDWFKHWGIPVDYVYPMPKPTFVLAFFDDRAIHVGPKEQHWLDAVNEFKRRYESKLHNWQKEVLPPEVEK